MFWKGSHHRCEPFTEGTRVRQCYNCYGFDHTAKQCRMHVRCPHCSLEHEEKECPNSLAATKRCANCKGAHTAFDRACPVWKIQEGRAKAAWNSRPQEFALTEVTSSLPQTQLDSDGFQVVEPRKSQRPAKRARAGIRAVAAVQSANSSTIDAYMIGSQPGSTQTQASEVQVPDSPTTSSPGSAEPTATSSS